MVSRRGGWPCTKWNRSSTEDFGLYSLLKYYEFIEEIDPDLHKGLLLILPIKSYEISKEIEQELHRALLLIFLIQSE